VYLKVVPVARTWFIVASLFLLFALLYTAIFSAGLLLYPTLYIEQWLLHRPVTGVDCVLMQWRRLGDVDVSLVLTVGLGILCLIKGYRCRVLLYLVLLLLLTVGIEIVGKNLFAQPMPNTVGAGLSSLGCPQLGHQPPRIRLAVAVGMWWEAPALPLRRVEKLQRAELAPRVLDDDVSMDYGYPSGHAMRWAFIGIVAGWISARHVRRRLLRNVLLALACLVALGGGFAQFYIGVHLSNDLVVGYLLGASSACCAIGLLMQNERRIR
jgi:membrane-associated phospholipid phosphatase